MRHQRYGALFCVLLYAFTLSAQQRYQLSGILLGENGEVVDGTLAVNGTHIAAPSAGKDSGSIPTDSYILPGFIDLHNHITWNVFPRWRPYALFPNRYAWQQRPDYAIALDTAHKLLAANHDDDCAANEYGEIKALVGGATSIAGSIYTGNTDCALGLVRNLDLPADSEMVRGDGSKYQLSYQVFPFRLPVTEADAIRQGLAQTPPVPLIAHVAEGNPNDAASAVEFSEFENTGFLRRGATIIHGVALKPADFQKMIAAGVGLVWSPRSNIELYGQTADVATAHGLKTPDGHRLTIALSPDWSPSGSDGMLQELKYAAVWDAGHSQPVFGNEELVRMLTINPARLAGLDEQLGSLAPGKLADLVLIRHRGKIDNPYDAIVAAGPADVRLVVIGGVPVYGDADLMAKFHPGAALEPITICGSAKALFLEKNASGFPRPWKEISERLEMRLQQIGTSLAPLTACSGTNLN